jgi:WD40 repeat protein
LEDRITGGDGSGPAPEPASDYPEELARFGEQLTALHIARGGLSLRSIHKRMADHGVGRTLAPQTIGAILGGRRMTDIDSLMALVRTLMTRDEQGLELALPSRTDPSLRPWRAEWTRLETLRRRAHGRSRTRTREPEARPALRPATGAPATPGPDLLTDLTYDYNAVAGTAELSPDTRLLAFADGGVIQLLDPATGGPVHQPLAQTGPVDRMAFSPDGRVLAVAGRDGTARLWDPATGKPIPHPLSAYPATVYAVAFAPDGRILAAAHLRSTAQLWDVGTGEPIGLVFKSPFHRVQDVAFSPDGRLFATAGQDGNVQLWDAKTWRLDGDPIGGHRGEVTAVAFAPDGLSLAGTGVDGTLRFWDTGNGRPVGGLLAAAGKNGGADGPGRLLGLAYSPDGRLLATAGADGAVRLWNPHRLHSVGEPLTGHAGAVTSVAFSPDGRLLASSGTDGTIRVWLMSLPL